jgi:hypothetical protein
MKVAPILARLLHDRELTHMVVCQWIYPCFQASLYPILSQFLVMFPNSLTQEVSLKGVETLRDEIYQIKGQGSVRSLVLLYNFLDNCYVGAHRRGRPQERSLV